METYIKTLIRRQADIADPQNDQRIGSARSGSSNVSALVSSIVINLIIFLVVVGLFMLLRRSHRRLYMPKTYVTSVPERMRKGAQSVPGNDGLFSWITGVGTTDDATLLKSGGLDAYFFVRYLRTARRILCVGCIFTVPILIAVNATGGGTEEGLNKLTLSNVDNKNRYWAHILVEIIFFSFIMFTIYQELIYFVKVRQAYMSNPSYSARISARTVLITSVPDEYLHESTLRRLFDNVKRVWINPDTSDLNKIVERRDKVAMKLEESEAKSIIKANKEATKNHTHRNVDVEAGRGRQRTNPAIGKRSSSIDSYRNKLATLIPQVADRQVRYRNGEGKKLSSVFIEFTSQHAAQVAVQVLAHHSPLHMSRRYVGITPNEVIWDNLNLGWFERLIKTIITTSMVIALIIFFSIPVAVVGTISSITYLVEKVPFLSFINNVPDPILGLITGVLPSIMIAILMALVPLLFRFISQKGGAACRSEIELWTQKAYFPFLVVQVFLVLTLASGASAVIVEIINDVSSTPTLLSRSIPTASNFYISFMIFQGLTVSALALLQVAALHAYKVFARRFAKTPRKLFQQWSTLVGIGWGTLYPKYTNITVIAIIYTIIAPLVTVFAALALCLFSFTYKHNVLFVYDTKFSTKGLVYPRALYQTMTGIYLAEICLIGLFGLRKAIGPAVVQAIFLVFTILFNITLKRTMAPVCLFLPQTLDGNESIFVAEQGLHSSTTLRNSNDNDLKKSRHTSQPPPNERFLARLFSTKSPDHYQLRSIVPSHEASICYTHEQERDAYYHPAITSRVPVLWLPMSAQGFSGQRCIDISSVISCTDEGAFVDENNRIQRQTESTAPPDYEWPVPY